MGQVTPKNIFKKHWRHGGPPKMNAFDCQLEEICECNYDYKKNVKSLVVHSGILQPT
jgi:hypothetical protein